MKRSSDACASPAPKQQPRKIKATAASSKATGKHAIRSSAPHDAVGLNMETMPPPGKKASRAIATTLRQRLDDAKVNVLGSPFKYTPRNRRDGEKDKDKDSDDEKVRKGPRPRNKVEIVDTDAEPDAAPGAPHATVVTCRDQAMRPGFQGRDPSPGYDSRVSSVEAHQLMRKLEAIQLAPKMVKRTLSAVQPSKSSIAQQQKKTGHRPPHLELQDSNCNFEDSAVETAALKDSAVGPAASDPALDNFAIGIILKECKPNDYKAVMWERAAKLGKSNEPKDALKALIFLKMNARVGWKQNFLGRAPQFKESAQMTERGGDGLREVGEGAGNGRGSKGRFDKVRAAHRRLQDAMYGDILAEQTAA